MNEVPDATVIGVDSPGDPARLEIRKTQREDKEPIRAILLGTDVFRPEEVEIAMELVDAVLDRPEEEYEMYTCVTEGGEIVGFLCIGPTPITKGTFDLYWIAVKPFVQRHGIGKRLLEYGEQVARSHEGRLIVAETSSQPKYLKARTFYLHNGFAEVAHIRDYYDIDDDLVIYGKYLQQRP